jgi:galactose oxidase-like protein
VNSEWGIRPAAAKALAGENSEWSQALLALVLVMSCAALQAAEPNEWVRVCAGKELARVSAAMVWVPKDKAFVLLGGSMGMWKPGSAPYTEMTLNLKEARWENRFPKGKLGAWGELTGPSKAPGFPGSSYYGIYMKDKEGTVRPYLGSGYDRAMFLYRNYTWDSDRGRVIVFWHHGGITGEYDPAERAWTVTTKAKDLPKGMLDDFLWGAMCYDPVNKEVLGGQGRWAYKDGKWRRLHFRHPSRDSFLPRMTRLRDHLEDLIGRCRSRYYHSETPKEAKANLMELAGTVRKAAEEARKPALIVSILGDMPPEFRMADTKLDLAWKAIGRATGLLEKGVTAEVIHQFEDARDQAELAELAFAVQPPRRAFSMMAYDPVNKVIVLFGGDRLDRRLADTWVYDCKTRTWEQRFPKRSPSPRAGHALLWLPKAKKILLVDGWGAGAGCWTYDVAKNEWALLAGPKRTFGLMPRPKYSYHPGAVAASDDDRVVLTYRTEKFRGRPDKSGTWTAKIDATKVDVAGTQKLGVPPLTMSAPYKYTNPRWYETQVKTPPDPSAGKALDNIPANTWVRLKPAGNPRVNRAWGTTVLDTKRDQLLQYGGGHSAYCGTDVLHYSIKTNRCSTGVHLPEFTLNWNGSMLGPPIAMSYAGRPQAKHGYRHYGYDRASGKMIWYSHHAGRFFTYDPSTRDWKGPFGAPVSRKYGGSHHFIFCSTPQGLTIWASSKELWRLDSQKMVWSKLPVKERLAGMRVDCHSMACDTKRNRLIFFYLRGKSPEVNSYDLKTAAITRLKPVANAPIAGFCREAIYVPNADVVFIGKVVKLSDGKSYWLCFDCSKDEWIGVALGGKGTGIGVSTGLQYDPKRKLIWNANARMDISVVRLDMAKATIRRLKDEPAPAK